MPSDACSTTGAFRGCRPLPDSVACAPARANFNKRSPTSTDAEVGRRIRDCRISIGMPLAALSAAVGVSQPQLCRYEAGVTRVAASRLVAIAGVLGVSVEVLTRDANSPAQPDPAERVEQALLLRAFGGITRADHRSALLALAHALATTAHDTEVDL